MAAANEPLSVCHIVCYRDPRYIRTTSVSAALQQIENIRVHNAINQRAGWLRYFETLLKVIAVRLRHHPDVYILGFRGHEIFPLIRLFTIGRPLIFDAFMSPSDALISEGKSGAPGRAIGKLLRPFEKLCLTLSKRCWTDTQSHKSFFASQFGITEDRIDVVHVGAVSDNDGAAQQRVAAPENRERPFTVLFYGTFLPLHGMDVLLQACGNVASSDVQIHIIGGKGRALEHFHALAEDLELTNMRHDSWVEFDALKNRVIPGADLCLGGPFGDTPQARRVVTGKTIQFLSLGKPTVIGATDEPIEFVDKSNCLLVEQGNPDALAAAIDWAALNRDRLDEIGQHGRRLFEAHFSTEALTRQAARSLAQL